MFHFIYLNTQNLVPSNQKMHFLSSRFLISSAVIGLLTSKFSIPSNKILAAPILDECTIILLIFKSSKFFFIELHGFQSCIASPKALNDKKRKEIINIFFIPNFCITSARRSKSRNHQKVKKSARSFARSF